MLNYAYFKSSAIRNGSTIIYNAGCAVTCSSLSTSNIERLCCTTDNCNTVIPDTPLISNCAQLLSGSNYPNASTECSTSNNLYCRVSINFKICKKLMFTILIFNILNQYIIKKIFERKI